MARLGRAQPFATKFKPFRLGAATIALSGTIIGASETDIVTGGKTILLTVTGDTWVSGGAFTASRAGIISGLVSAQSEATGWNNVVVGGQSVAGVVRTSDSLVTITLDAFATYNITANETITVTVPSTALLLNTAIVATPTFNVTAVVAGVDQTAQFVMLGSGPSFFRAGRAA